MSVRTEIQNKIMVALSGIEFPVIEYDDDNMASESGDRLTAGSVIVNEFQGTSTPSRDRTSVLNDISDWLFEAMVAFDKEVDINDVFFNNLGLNFTSTDGILVYVKSDNFYVQHPPRKGSSTGTKCRLTFKVTTRR